MMLPAAMFPMASSVRELVLKRFTHPESLLRGAQIMAREELDEYVAAYSDTALSPLDAVLRAAEAVGDPTLPPTAESALLGWVGAAFAYWEQEFPLDPTLALKLRALKPLAAASALNDPRFLQPGAHPLHQLLDALHDAAIGWQAELGRSGESVVKLIDETCATLLDDGLVAGDARQRELQLAAATESAQRLRSRSLRMNQRVADVERARMRSNYARATAAGAINQCLGAQPLPEVFGRFLRGPWFDSAQLVLLKFGAPSAQWTQMQQAAQSLVTARLPGGESSSADAHSSAGAIRKLLERWLLSLQHQPDAVRRELGELEYQLLRLLGGQAVERAAQDLIEFEPSAQVQPAGDPALPATIAAEQWLLLRESADFTARLQVVLRQDEQQQLVLSHLSGQRPRSMGFAEFSQLLARGAVSLLHSGASFSRALAVSAGVKRAPAGQAPASQASAPPATALNREPAPQQLPDAAAPTAPAREHRELPLPPLGTWLGFHDIDPPLLAKLAMHDAVRRLVIFVNRKGVELRRLDEEQYLALIDGGLVDILETRSNFRDEVERARRRLQRHGQ